ncbi:hypothetical protein [Kitasatospora terrestris]|uniref:Gram-positive cocci surface proteins LPxTG domain-containing protein n=1 Tax=Kitasatospora terrestris TaxID=258051 RepID=A0ABP9DX23_9ACTN
MAAPRYPRSAFLSPRLTAARRWAAVTGAGLALPLLVAGTAAATGPDTPPGEGRTVEPAVQQVPARISAALPAVPVTPVLPGLPQLPQVPVASAVTVQPSTPVPTDPGETCPPSGEPTRATPVPSPSAEPSDAAEPSPSVPASPSVSPTSSASATATASPSASPVPTAAAGRIPPAHGGERGTRHQPAPAAALPEEPELVVPAEPADGWDEEAGDALPPMAGPDGPSPSAPVTAATGATRPQAAAQAQADAALPLHWTDPSTLQLPLGAGLTLIGFGLALVGFRLRHR